MADLFDSGPSKENPFSRLCYVYILYFDEALGHMPLLIYPDDKLKNDKKFMRPIRYHSIWFLDVEETSALDHIDLEYKGFTFFGKKFLTKSNREKRRAGLEKETPETIVIIVSMPNDISIFGSDLIRKLTKEIRDKFEDKLFQVIEGETVKDAIIKTPKIKECIDNATKIKVFLRELIDNITKEYFDRIAEKPADKKSMKIQKAISFLSLKGYDFSSVSSSDVDSNFSSINLFDQKNGAVKDLEFKSKLSISNIMLIEDSQEIEIIVQNNTEEELKNLNVQITHIKEFFEKEVFNQEIDLWYPGEELLFICPIMPHINEYLFFIIVDTNGKEKLVSSKIDINTIKKVES